jgi:hypothetical protein
VGDILMLEQATGMGVDSSVARIATVFWHATGLVGRYRFLVNAIDVTPLVCAPCLCLPVAAQVLMMRAQHPMTDAPKTALRCQLGTFPPGPLLDGLLFAEGFLRVQPETPLGVIARGPVSSRVYSELPRFVAILIASRSCRTTRCRRGGQRSGWR